MTYVYIDPADYIVGKSISAEEYAQLVENANQAYGAAVNHGEILATRSAITAVGFTVTGSTPGPYSWVVPAGITRILIEIVGGGGGSLNDSGGGSPGAGGTSSVVGSTSGTIASAAGGAPGNGSTPSAGGAASGRIFKGGNGNGGTDGGGSAGPFAAGTDGLIVYTSPTVGPFQGYGDGAASPWGSFGSGAGAAGGRFLATVVPGETITITVGAGGTAGSGGGFAGQPGRIHIST